MQARKRVILIVRLRPVERTFGMVPFASDHKRGSVAALVLNGRLACAYVRHGLRVWNIYKILASDANAVDDVDLYFQP